MPDVRYVCLSDTHFGADNSLLTNLRAGTATVEPLHASPVLQALAACLSDLISKNQNAAPPTLILNGDIMELALTSDNNAAMAFERFMELIVPNNGKRLFANEMIYVAGNHDHHLWETARETQYANFIDKNPDLRDLPIPWHTTNIFSGDPVPAFFLNTLIQRHDAMKDITVRAVYPNFGLNDGHGKLVIFSHGHYIESIYTLMTNLRSMIFPDRKPPVTIWDLEAENFAWIDFFWSTLGRSGGVGTDVELIYNMMTDPRKLKILINNLAAGIVREFGKQGLGGRIDSYFLGQFLNLTLGRVAATERHDGSALLTPDATAGLKNYIEGVLLTQLDQELNHNRPTEWSFVFGHTHKPYEDTGEFAGYPGLTGLYNSGGWVVDTPQAEPLHGASAVLVDENLDVVSLRFYNQQADAANYAVRVSEAQRPNGTHSAFYERLQGLINPNRDPWKSFSAVVAGEIPLRLRIQGEGN
ncbi:MAG TPA: metallophosphoesterase [Terriglobia bacterium]|jgi:hypothetical protein